MKTDCEELKKLSQEIFEARAVARWISIFYSTLGVKKVETDENALRKVHQHIVNEMNHTSSIFQLTGHFVAAFCHYRPIKSKLPEITPWITFKEIDNYQNCIAAVELCRYALAEVYFILDEDTPCLRAPELRFDRDYYYDLIVALSTCDLVKSPQLIALLFESLVYSETGRYPISFQLH